PSPSIGRSGWQCPICDHMNGGSADKCTLCGVPYEEPAQKAELQLTCPVCTFHNHVSMARCEMCETELKRPVPPTPDQDLFGENALQPYRMRSLGAESDDEDAGSLLKLSFRAGGSSTFHSALKEVLGDKAWLETVEAASSSQQQQEFPADRRPTVGGISTLVSAAHESERTRDDTLKTAFADLDGLAAKAKEIVSLAEKIATQLNSPAASKLRGKGIGSGGDDDNTEQADAFRQYLLDLGIDSPVTKDTAGAMFHEELARELSDFLENYVARHGGTVALVDAYCLYNRAREFSLVYPADFVQACRNFGRLRLALRLREYPSGLLTIEDASSASDAAIIQRVDQYIRSFGPLSSSELAAIEECSLPLAEEHLALCERAGQVCRDETVEGVRFHMNQFTQSAGVA
ncbi:Vacuolar protein-sorting-associated protein 36, partial [Linderina macrospora]